MKKITILMGSPKKNGNTNAILKPFMETLENQGSKCSLFWLYDMDIKPCTACRVCQNDQTIFGCSQKDDVQKIFDEIMASDLIVLATPVYSWYCTPPMKALLDRLVYGMNKYYGEEKGPSLWKGKDAVLITTCGYPPRSGADLLEEGVKRYCKHSQLHYRGMLVERHLGYKSEFMDDEKNARAIAFAKEVL